MATAKKNELELTVKVDDAVSDGEGGFLAKGAKVVAADEDAAESLKAKGLAG